MDALNGGNGYRAFMNLMKDAINDHTYPEVSVMKSKFCYFSRILDVTFCPTSRLLELKLMQWQHMEEICSIPHSLVIPMLRLAPIFYYHFDLIDIAVM